MNTRRHAPQLRLALDSLAILRPVLRLPAGGSREVCMSAEKRVPKSYAAGWLFLLSLAIVGLCSNLYGQGQLATLTGHVTDTSQAVVQKGRAVVAPGGKVVRTDGAGDFNLTGLTAGT